MYKYLLKLYITGHTTKSDFDITRLQRLCKERLGGQYEVVVIDTQEHPQLTEDDQILSLARVVGELPLPFQQIIGELYDSEKMLLGLDLKPLTL